ncbi:Ubiquitin domain-containing protein DSK2b [Carex littledalei]|uniref:Ubiquitin domain-containing protein DSK2b n=1 Tax=Carex littledalei TaxID=544730 RepID=A0A833QDK5_9POAL|nr:Ubiquitin domain-containing protein DSK2b [Carex littledalei]
MGSDGESTDDEPTVSLQIQLPDRSQISVATELDITVEEFKLVLANLTGIPSDEQRLIYNGTSLRNHQTIGNCVLDPDKVISLVRRATPPPNTSIVSMSSPITPRSPREACKLDVSNRSFKNPQTRLLDKHPHFLANIIERIPILRQLKDKAGIILISQYLCHVEIQRRIASLNAIITEIITRKLKSVYNGHHDISLVTEENQLSLLLSGLNLVATSGSGPESSNSNQSELAPNSHLLSGPESSNANQSESAPNSDPLPNPWAANSYRATILPLIDHEETIDKVMLLLFSDATLLRHCIEQGESINRAFAAVYDNASQDQSSSLLSSLGGSDDFAPKEAVSEEQFASQLAQMEDMGFMDRRENLRALLKSGGDVQKAVKRLLEKRNLDEGR